VLLIVQIGADNRSMRVHRAQWLISEAMIDFSDMLAW
jgi:hypothetical protein